MNPYYQDDLITVFNADCRDVLPTLTDRFFVWTDPPYNVSKDYGGWDDAMPDDEYIDFCNQWISLCASISDEMCIYPPNKYLLKYWNILGENYKQIVLPWTPEGAIRYGFVDQFACLLTNAKPKVRTKNVWTNMQMRGLGYFFKENDYGHPGYTSEHLTSKVLQSLAAADCAILDPFGGTGTTARIATNTGRKCTTIEYSEQWCEFIVNQRLRQMVLVAA